MRKLLSILGTMMLVGTASTNVIACGNNQEEPINPEDNGVKIEDLLTKAEDKIKVEFGNLVNESKNLFFANQSPLGEDYHQLLLKMPATEDTEITNENQNAKSFIDFFTKRIQNNINDDILPQLLLDKDLRLLFNGIANSNILKLTTNDTRFWKMVFKWEPENNQANDFDIDNYRPSSYNINYWYEIKIDLNLELTYNNEKNQQVKKIINQSYTCYFANEGADITGVINAASLKINEKLAKQVIAINLNKDEDISDGKRLAAASDKIIETLNNNKIEINDITFDNMKSVSTSTHFGGKKKYEEADKFYNAFNKEKGDSSKYLKQYLKEQVVEKFNNKLTDWINKLSDEEKDSINESTKSKINGFGKISINNWTISGLTLKSIKLNFFNVRNNQTRTEWIVFMAETLAKIFSQDGIIKDAFNIINDTGNLIMYMNNSDFADYYKNNKNLAEVSQYFNEKIKRKAEIERAITAMTPFSLSLNGCDSEEPVNLQNQDYVQKKDDKTLAVIKNPRRYYNYLSARLDGFWFIVGSKKVKYSNYHIEFDSWIIKQADGDIWRG